MNNFKVHGLADIYENAKRGNIAISITPNGYWTDVIHIYIRREWSSRCGGGTWSQRISTSSGGISDDVSNIEAMGNFVEGIQFALTLIKSIDIKELDRIYEAHRESQRQENK